MNIARNAHVIVIEVAQKEQADCTEQSAHHLE
jgi:hypothetical protein